jgi:enoyl-CoA hydratase/carnithine racemase
MAAVTRALWRLPARALPLVRRPALSHPGPLLAAARLSSTAAPPTAQPHVTVELLDGGVALLTLTRPASLNALTVAMGDEFEAALRGLDYSAARAVVVTGAGRAFSAGGDLAFLRARAASTGSKNAAVMRAFYDRFACALRRCPVPTLAAINGHAVGAGLCLAVAADLRVAARSAKLSISFVGIGLHPGMGATYWLPQLVGPQQAARLCLTGEAVSGEEAARIGLVLEAVDDAEVLPRTLALARRIAAQAPVAVRGTARSLRLQADADLDAALAREADAQSYCYSGPDLLEGVEAVAAKRAPVWRQYESYEA